MEKAQAQVIVAGHICLDVIPTIASRSGDPVGLLAPGRLVNVGPALLATGGAVSNTGLALHRLGVPTRLMGKIGDDLFGRAVLDIISRYDPALAEGMLVSPHDETSYTIVISPPGVDRTFLHCPGANDTFGADDIADDLLADAPLFHFGYPPLMRRLYRHEGRETEQLFRRIKTQELTTSLDMSNPDYESEAGQAPWPAILARVLPHVDLYLPSLEETMLMLQPARFLDLTRRVGMDRIITQVDGNDLQTMADQLLAMGAAVVVLKLGDQGLYLRTTSDPARLAATGRTSPVQTRAWLGRELLSPCFLVDVVGTTGSGDCTIAGFLTGWLAGLTPEAVMTGAVGVGACNVEQADSVSGIPAWETVQARIAAGWSRRPIDLDLPGWTYDEEQEIWIGPADAGRV